ncbi:MAG: fibronectin type III domain-containing protein, partial [bacterium]
VRSGEETQLNFELSPVPLAKPTNLQATAISDDKIILSWQDNSGNEDGFKIERKTMGDLYAQITTVAEDVTTYTDIGLNVETPYGYRIKAYSSQFPDSDYSDEKDATTLFLGAIFYDNFNRGNSSGWTQIRGSWRVEDGKYIQNADGEGITLAGDTNWDNYAFEVKMNIKSLYNTTDWEGARLLFRLQDTSKYYCLELDPTYDRARIVKLRDGSKEILASTSNKAVIMNLDTEYKAEVIVQGNNIKAYINGKLILQATDSSYSSGKIGIGTWKSSAYFDEVKVNGIRKTGIGTIRGMVKPSIGETKFLSIPGIEVRIPELGTQTTTDANSNFIFCNLPSGFYTLAADAPACSGGTESGIVVNGNTTTDIGTITLLAADGNNDGQINILEWPLFVDAFDSIPGDSNWNPEADFNYDKVVDVLDFYVLTANFGKIQSFSETTRSELDTSTLDIPSVLKNLNPKSILITENVPHNSGAVIYPQEVKVSPGEFFDVELVAGVASSLIGAKYSLSFDPQILEVVSITDGSFPPNGFVVQKKFDNIKGTIDFAVLTEPVQGLDVLAYIRFKNKIAGTSSISFNFIPPKQKTQMVDNDGNPIPFLSSNAQIEVDITPPTTPIITDDGVYTNNITQLHAICSSTDPETGIAKYKYTIGTKRGGTDTTDGWILIDTNEITRTGLSLTNGLSYYFTVKAKNGAGLWSDIGFSNGITVDINPPTITNPKASPNPVNPGQSVKLEAYVVDSLSGVGSVTIDLSSIGGLLNQPMSGFGNGTYTYTYTIPNSVSLGTKTLTITAKDNAGNTSTTKIDLTIQEEKYIKQLTTNPDYDGSEAFSPDGKKIVYRSFNGGAGNLWVMDINGDNKREILPLGSNGCGPNFSPDGKYLAFSNGEDIFVSTNIQEVINKNASPLLVQITTGSDDNDHWPCFSPDGKWLAYGSTKNGNRDIYVITNIADVITKQAPSQIKRLTTNVSYENGPCFSPDGKKIVFISNCNGDYHDWAITNVVDVIENNASPIMVQVTNCLGDEMGRFSPDGKMFAFSSMMGGNAYDGWLIKNIEDVFNGLSANIVPLTNWSGSEGPDDWSPDGTKLLIGSNKKGNWDIYIIDYLYDPFAFPAANIVYPILNQKVSGKVEIKGRAMDNISVDGKTLLSKLSSYTLEYGEGENPSKWNTIITSSSSIDNGILGTWDTTKLTNGTYTLKLTATDGKDSNIQRV